LAQAILAQDSGTPPALLVATSLHSLLEAMGCGKSKPAAAAPAAAETKQETILDDQAAKDVKPEEPKPDQVEASKGETIKVEIIGARGLRNADFDGKSEPYCIVEIAGKTESKVQTKVAEDPKEPQWNHAAEVVGFSAGDSLVFKVKDCDPLKDDLLGKVVVTEEQVKSGFVGELQLSDCGEGIEAFLKVKVGEPSMLESVKEGAKEIVQDVAEKLEDAKEAIQEKLEETFGGKETADQAEAGAKTEKAAEAPAVQIEDETKASSCTC